MLGNEEHQLHSPITPLSYDFNKKRGKSANSPDILERTSPDIVSRIKKEKYMKSEENLRLRSPDYSETDYAPVSTERWVITDNCQGDLIKLNVIFWFFESSPKWANSIIDIYAS